MEFAPFSTAVVVVAVAAAVEVGEVADVEILTMIEDMIVGTTDMKTMITGTEEDHFLLIIVIQITIKISILQPKTLLISRAVAVEDIFFSFFNSGFPQASNPFYSSKRTLKKSLVCLASTLCQLYCYFPPLLLYS